ncbi:MAG: ammonium transporter [Alphaproteobacteria bacterium]|nr:ammonium transporter [Alphaproteobacteria bacterium]
MNIVTKWLGRTIVAGAAALILLSTPVQAQDAAAPPATIEAAPADAAAPPDAAPPAEAPAAEAPAEAEAEGPIIDTGDTAWMLTSTALVLLMTIPGLALFYGGMVRKKNVLATLAQSFAITGLVTVLWMVVGYSLAFTDGGDHQALFGGFSYLFLNPMGLNSTASLAPTIPESVFMTFQMTFAIITPALITGAFADRMKFSALMWFMGLWVILVYCPIAHWVWGGGLLGGMGVLDYAGGTVVHLNAGTAGLVAALVLGKRVGHGTENMAPHNVGLSLIGASLLWVGWFGFNAGSAVSSNVNAGMAMAVTQIATAAASLAWMFTEWMFQKKPSVLGMISGAVAGLVAITPASGFVDPKGALVIGLAAGLVCYIASVPVKRMFGYDDALDVWGVHGVGGALGAILTGVFASNAINGLGKGWLYDGNFGQVFIQFQGILYTMVYCGIATFIILKVVDLIVGLRVKRDVEVEGLDINLHGETVHS